MTKEMAWRVVLIVLVLSREFRELMTKNKEKRGKVPIDSPRNVPWRGLGRLERRGLSTPGQGQGEGPAGDKFERSEDAGNGGRGRSEAAAKQARTESPQFQAAPACTALSHGKPPANPEETRRTPRTPRERRKEKISKFVHQPL